MTQKLVMILSDDYGYEREEEDQYWHLVERVAGGEATFCQGEYFGIGESGCKYKTKEVMRGGITCPYCLERIKKIKAVRL